MWWPTFKGYKVPIYRFKERKTNSLTFSYGQKLPFDSGNPNLAFTMREPKDYDLIFHTDLSPEQFTQYDHLTNTGPGIILVNQKVKSILLELCPDDVQFFPAVIVPDNPRKMSFENHDYEVLNITRLIDVFDKNESDLILYDDEDVQDIKKLRFKEIEKYNFYLGRQITKTLSIIASPELVKRIKKDKVTGVKFLKDYEYKG
ncbi:MAG: hypothetical protein C0440_02720 [Candidatus Pelagibacter sp.]|nr:hypothetical protein [Candidatus Pelagibacter sp.]